jgi:integrase
MLIAAGWDIADVSARLGHADVNTTLKTYTHEFDKANRRKERRDSLDRLSLANAAPSTGAVVDLR